MPAKNPRINVVLEKPLYETIRRMAKRNGESLSEEIRDLVREAVETYEDRVLSKVAERREESFVRDNALTHGQVWKANRVPKKKKK